MEYVAGIDGGGTRTRVICMSPEGREIDRKDFGPFNLTGIGRERFSALWAELTAYLRETGTCAALCAGGAGASSRELISLSEEAIRRAGIPRWRIVGDQEIALYGALEGRPGCLCVAGTGSVCFGRNALGQTARAGGWGHILGDEGSGYALGRDALAAVTRQMDGWGETTVLTELMQSEAGLLDRASIVELAYGGKDRVAALAPLAERAAASGDRVALRIIREGAAKLAEQAAAVARQLGLAEGELALCGGLLEHDTLLRRELVAAVNRLMPAMRCVKPLRSAAEGAAMMAAELAGWRNG